MKTSSLLPVFLFLQYCTLAQPVQDMKRDYVWIFGYYAEVTPGGNGILFDFTGDTMAYSYFTKSEQLGITYTNSSICDENGNLMFYSNGCRVADATNQFIVGGDTINNGYLWYNQCGSVLGYGLHQGMVALPFPEIENQFALLYQSLDYYPGIGAKCNRLAMTKISKDFNDSFYTTHEDYPLYLDSSLLCGYLSSIRHGNSEDWWVLTINQNTNANTYKKFIVEKDTIRGPYTQSIGNPYFQEFGGSDFSPDGTKYVTYNSKNDLQIFDFDRCTGELYNPLHIPITDAADTFRTTGVAISSNSRYLYLASSKYIYQFDLWASDIAATKTTVAVYDGYQSPPGFQTLFHQMQLAPDKKIYITGPGGRQTIHVIEYPDSAGLACQVVQHKYDFTAAIGGGLPHFPNFRLGPIARVAPAFTYAATQDTVFFQNQSLIGPGTGAPPAIDTTWLWDFGDGQASTEASPVHIYAQPGTYQVVLTASSLCVSESDTMEVEVIFTSSKETRIPPLRLRPNPTSGEVWLDAPGCYSVTLYDGWGRLALVAFPNASRFDISSLAAGEYWCMVKGKNGEIIQRGMIVKG
jgi:hypothetical protein